MDIQGYIVEKLSGQPLDVFLRTKIFEPLGMKDTGFWMEASKADRITQMFTYDADKRIIVVVVDGNVVSGRAWPDHPGWMRAFMGVLKEHAPA